MHEPMGNVLALLLLKLLGLAFFLRRCRAACCACCCFCHNQLSNLRSQGSGARSQEHLLTPETRHLVLCLRRRLLLLGDRAFTRAFTGTRVGVRTLAADG